MLYTRLVTLHIYSDHVEGADIENKPYNIVLAKEDNPDLTHPLILYRCQGEPDAWLDGDRTIQIGPRFKKYQDALDYFHIWVAKHFWKG